MPAFSGPKTRRSQRVQAKQRASLVFDLARKPKRLPCLVLDSSKEGFRLRVSFPLKRGQKVEIVLEDEPLNSVRCSVVWVGKPKSEHEGEVGVETL
ncbi:MAG TPA: hypothetical protein VJX70_06275 [Candidatus Acidoferrum sp.]|nr:hypothetical protein [Candidatus Acidoferrum sp.]